MRWVCLILMLCGGAAADEGVAVTRFEPLVPNQAHQWIGQAIQQNLVLELGRDRVQAMAVENPAQVAAAYVVVGSYQVVEEGLRITGQVRHGETGKVVGGLKATGTMRDLFALEDEIAEQTKRILSRERFKKNGAQTTQGASIAITRLEPSGPVTMGYARDREPSLLEQVAQERRWNEQERSLYHYRYSIGPAYWYWGYGLPNFYYGRRYYWYGHRYYGAW